MQAMEKRFRRGRCVVSIVTGRCVSGYPAEWGGWSRRTLMRLEGCGVKETVRNRVGTGMRKRMKCFAFFIAVFLLALSVGGSISASEDIGRIGFVFSRGAGGEYLSGAAAVALRLDHIYIIADMAVLNDDASSYVFIGDQEHTTECHGEMADTKTALFIVPPDVTDTKILDCDSACEGETVSLHYLCDDGEVTEKTLSMTITGYEELEGYYFLNWSASQADVEEMQETGFYLPGAVVNDAGKLVGILAPSGDIVTYYVDTGRFSDSAEPPSGERLFPGGGDSSRAVKGRPEEPTAAPMTEPTAAPEPEPAPFPSGIVGWIVIIIFGLILLLYVLKVLKKGKKAAQKTVHEIQPTMPVKEDIVRPTPDVPAAEPKTAALYLCCEGGVMDGRRYPVMADGILIGRDPECNICYPSDTQGISRKHCRLFWNKGVLMIMDLGSTSGTFIRGKGQIGTNVPVAVIAGDTFYLGEKKNAFSIKMR